MSAYTAPQVPTILTKAQRYRLHTWLALDLQGHTLEEIREHLAAVQANRQASKKARLERAREVAVRATL